MALAPLADRLRRSADRVRGLKLVRPSALAKGHAGARDQAMGHGGGVGDALQLGAVAFADRERGRVLAQTIWQLPWGLGTRHQTTRVYRMAH